MIYAPLTYPQIFQCSEIFLLQVCSVLTSVARITTNTDSKREGNERRLGCSREKNAVRKNKQDKETSVFLLLIVSHLDWSNFKTSAVVDLKDCFFRVSVSYDKVQLLFIEMYVSVAH